MKCLIMFCVLLVSNSALSEGRIEVTTDDQDGIRWLDFYGEGIPASYGMELEVRYSNDDLSIVDSNRKKPGLQIQGGDFFSASAYEISNNVDVKKGRIRYAVSLLKPADSVFGGGHLARIGFMSKSNKAVNIEFVNIRFGTKAGNIVEVLYPFHVLVEPALTVPRTSTSMAFKPLAYKLEQKKTKGLSSQGFRGNDLLYIGLLSSIVLLFIVILVLRHQKSKVVNVERHT